mgnify:CR=1 FL=1|tara:strand:+ start:781 stop:1881 length:1101 start_codon:yes stop_codon:yes gene_type:complete
MAQFDITISPFKETLAIYTGYTTTFNGENYHSKNIYGSENSAIKLAESMVDKYNVIIFIFNLANEKEESYHNGVYYLDAKRIDHFKSFDILIILRFINYFIYFQNRSKKTYLWIQDLIINPMYMAKRLPYQGLNLLENVKSNIDGFVILSESHKQNLDNVHLAHNYNNKIPYTIIPNSLEMKYYKNDVPKIKNRFIYSSDPARGLDILIECYSVLKKKVPSSSLMIFRKKNISEELMSKIENLEDIILVDKVSQEELALEMLKSEYFFYPTTFCETFCNCAAEAQLYKCVCIYNNIGSLNTTIGNRGLEVNINDDSIDNYKIRATDSIIDLMNNEEKKSDYIKRGFEWAKTLDINIIKDRWLDLFT